MSLLSRALRSGVPNMLEAERELLGVDHAELGALIADRWDLPGVIVESIRFHHTPLCTDDPDVRTLSDVVSIADAAAQVAIDEESVTGTFDVSQSSERLGIDETSFDEICRSVGERLESALADYE